MTTGPVEYIIVGFPGNKFNGEIAPELIALVESGTVRILDLIFIGKDADGNVVSFEIDDLEGWRLCRARRPTSVASSVPRTSSTPPSSWSPTRRPRSSSGRICGRPRSPRPFAIRAGCCSTGPVSPTS